MDDRAGAGGVGMIEGPDLESAVFVRCLGRWRGHGGKNSPRRHQSCDVEDEDEVNGIDGENQYGPIEVSCGYTATAEDREEDAGGGPRIYTEERRELMRRGNIWIVRWSSVREAVTRGECELI